MKWKLWWRQLSVSAPRVAVRAELPWAVRLLALLAVATIVVGGIYGVYSYARSVGAPGRDDLAAQAADLREQLDRATAERERFAARAVQADNQLRIERATQAEMATQLKALEEDNARLKADLAFFESLLPAPAVARGVVVRSFRITPEADDAGMRYRLLVQQSGRPERDFVGEVALVFNVVKDGRATALKLPDPAMPAAGPAKLAFRHYQRVEGRLPLPAGASVRSVQVTITAGGETRAQQTFAM